MNGRVESLGVLGGVASAAPLVFLLLCVAFLPFIPATASWWHSNRNKFLLGTLFAAAGILLYVGVTGDWTRVFHSYLEYGAFITLLGALFVVSGGIHLSGAFAGFPYMNTFLLFIGAVMANGFGTMGASMMLIRPLLRANRHRRHKVHLFVFFIFIV